MLTGGMMAKASLDGASLAGAWSHRVWGDVRDLPISFRIANYWHFSKGSGTILHAIV